MKKVGTNAESLITESVMTLIEHYKKLAQSARQPDSTDSGRSGDPHMRQNQIRLQKFSNYKKLKIL